MNKPAEMEKRGLFDATILVVDDEPSNIGVLNAILQPHCRVRVARSGAEALRAIATTPTPDLVLLDVMMPEMDGYAVLAKLREMRSNRDLPVIFVTAMSSIADEQRGFELGAVDYITKPISPPIVLARVRAQLELKRARDLLARQNADLESEVERRVQENQKIQRQLIQAEKLSAMGLLLAGIAHEINNPMTFVKANVGSFADYLQEALDLLDAYRMLETANLPEATRSEKIRELAAQEDWKFLREDAARLLTETQEGIERITRLVMDLKNFSRAENDDWRSVSLHAGLDSTLNIVWNEIKYRCTLSKDYGVLPDVYCAPSKMNQVFLNLLVNAAQSIAEKGEITIRTGQLGGEVFVAIADTGAGIPDEDVVRLFDPFFTTKPVGIGTGLGLSIAHDIVQSHHGRIEVDSCIGKGTTFTVWLPIAPPSGEIAHAAS